MYHSLLKIIAALLGVLLNIGVTVPSEMTSVQTPVSVNQPVSATPAQSPTSSTQNNPTTSSDSSNPAKTQLPVKDSHRRIVVTKRQIEDKIRQRVKSLPQTTATQTKETVDVVTVQAGDRAVGTQTVQMASQLVQSSALPIINANLGLAPTQAVHVVLFSSAQTYGNSLLKAGLDPSSISAIVANTGGLTISSTIWIPLYNLQDQSDLANVLAHELTHVVVNQYGIGDTLPTWVNEGMAWRDGLMAQQKLNPEEAAYEMSALRQGVLAAKATGQLLPLTASESDILNAPYNVEYQDFMAVEQLVKQYGSSALKTFMQRANQGSIHEDFQNVFHMSIEQFQSSFNQSL